MGGCTGGWGAGCEAGCDAGCDAAEGRALAVGAFSCELQGFSTTAPSASAASAPTPTSAATRRPREAGDASGVAAEVVGEFVMVEGESELAIGRRAGAIGGEVLPENNCMGSVVPGTLKATGVTPGRVVSSAARNAPASA